MAKNIVICCDGTATSFGESKSNVVEALQDAVYDASQIAYYHPGVGTMGARNAATGSVSGGPSDRPRIRIWNLRQHRGCVPILMRTFQPEDTLYVFGFSRGAYTARALCGMLRIIGLLRRGQ